MTVITVLYNGDNIVGFVAKGHSGYAEHGEDIVCAAVSALTQTAYFGLEKLVKAEMEFHIKDGELHLMLSKGLDAEKREKAELILGTMLLGLRSVEENYSDHLKLIKREVKA